MRGKMLKTTGALLLLSCFLDVADANAADNDARVLSVSPSVISQYQGKTETLAVKMRVPVSASVVSDANGRAQLMFPDTTTVSIAPGTEIALAEFVDDPNEESIILNMAQGTARFITGDVSRRKPSAMVVNTPQASIGIRGTMVTIVVSGDTTKVYLTETSGRGVTVTNKHTGKSMKMVKPGRMITVTPRGMEDREGTLEEVRRMTVDLHTRPVLADDTRRRPERGQGVDNIAPAGLHGPGGVMDASLERGAALPVGPNLLAPTGPSPDVGPTPGVEQYEGTFASPAQDLSFMVDVNGNISGAEASVTNPQGGVTFGGINGVGAVSSGGVIDIGKYNPRSPDVRFDSMSTIGKFNNANSGDFTNSVDVTVPGTTTQQPDTYTQRGTFERQP